MSEAMSTNRPRRLRLQFSLRLLLLVLTAFAIGFPIWYRWPYTEVTAKGTRTTTWQRQWGGGRLQHGTQTLRQGKLVQTSNYRRGEPHGPYMTKFGDKVVERGQYVAGKKEGVWTYAERASVNWHRGQLDGKCEFKSRQGDKTIAMFADGRLTHVSGQPVEDHLFAVLQSNVVDQRTAFELAITTTVDVVEMPLKDTMLHLQEAHNVPIMLDQRRIPDIDLPLTGAYSGIGLGSALTLLTAPHGLACDYRYGGLWITTDADAKDWRDPTGVAKIQPPSGSSLASAWNEPITVQAINLTLADVLHGVMQRLAIEIDTTKVEPTSVDPGRFPITISARGLPLRHVLGQLLYNAGCRCKLEGETLVILPPDEP
jgi:hypothetical protein